MAKISSLQRAYNVAASNVVLSMEARTALRRIADEYYRETGEVLYVTSGTRTPEKQAEARYDNLYYGRNRETHYKDTRAYNEILGTYNEARRSGASKHAAVAAMTRIIEQQVSHHEYISLHLRGEAVDVRSRDMSYQQERAFQKTVDDVLGLHHWIVEGDHYHVQFR